MPRVNEQWSLDPELIRVVSPGQSDDFAGMTAMQRLLPADDSNGRHYLVPLPPGTYPDSPELFGFYTYEIRLGHDRGTEHHPFWSTAQGRFGAPLVLEGVQHPAPSLSCKVTRVRKGIFVSSSFAQAFYQGVDLQAVPPHTDLWFILYARVLQADAESMRNIELDKRNGKVLSRRHWEEYNSKFNINFTGQNSAALSPFATPRTTVQNIRIPLQGHALWHDDEVEQLLIGVGLPATTPLSFIGIELLPEPNGKFADPLGSNVGDVRILRTSPLQVVDDNCC